MPLHAAIVVALGLAASPAAERVAVASPALVALASPDMVALAPPPDKVRLDAKYLGPVILDHRAHLALRISCKSCHAGIAGKFGGYTAQEGHATCRGCHEEQKRGPTECRECHQATASAGPTTPPAAEAAPAEAPTAGSAEAATPAPERAAPAAPAESAAGEEPAGTATAAGGEAASGEGSTAPAAPPAAPAESTANAAERTPPVAAAESAASAKAKREDDERTPSPPAVFAPAHGAPAHVEGTISVTVVPPIPVGRVRGLGTVELGYVVLGASGGASGGPSIALKYRDGPVVFSQGIDATFESAGWRALALWGAGLGTPVRPSWNAVGALVAGVDVVHRRGTDVLPAVGGRVGVEWLKTVGPFSPLSCALTVTSDLFRGGTPRADAGGTTVSLSFAAGVVTRAKRVGRY